MVSSLTKMDGDTRGGAALSIKAVTGKPILLWEWVRNFQISNSFIRNAWLPEFLEWEM